MARYCNNCNKKFGFFEEDYDGMCKDCYDKKIEEERKRKYEEQQRKIKEQEEKRKLEEQQRIEQQRKLEEQRKENEKRRIEEQRKLKEKQQKEEEEKKKIEEQRKIENQKKLDNFKLDFSNSILSILIYKNIQDRQYILANIEFEEKYNNVSVYDIVNHLIKMSITQLDDKYTLLDIVNLFRDVNFFTNYISEFVYYDSFELSKNNFSDKQDFLKKNQKDIEEITLSYTDSNNTRNYLFEILSFMSGNTFSNINDYMFDDIWEASEYCKNSPYYILKVKEDMYALYVLYFYTLLILYTTKLSQYIKDFKNEKELYQMYENLKVETQDNIKYICDKLYPIYKNCYKNTFKEVLEYSEFSFILSMSGFSSSFEISQSLEFYNKFKKNFKDNNNNDDDITLQIQKTLEKMDFKELFDFVNECTESVFAFFLIILIMDSIRELVTLDEVLDVIVNFNTIRNNLSEKMTEYEAILERERLLKGDFSKEKAMQKQEVEYSNVQNGYEFEEYVANLYRKLGYTIEEVTKKSGDQRCRCYCL